MNDDMVILAVGRLDGDEEARARALAEILGLTLFDARPRVRAPAPRVVATWRDATEAVPRAVALEKAGFRPLLLAGENVEHDAQRIGVRSFELLADRVIFGTRSGESHEVRYSEIALLLAGTASTRQVQAETTTTRHFSLGKAVVTGGVMMTSRKTEEKTVVQEAHEPFLHVHATGHPTFLLRETELQYQGLGPLLQPVRLTNFRCLVGELRARAAGATYDDRLTSLGGQVATLGGVLPPDRHLDVALALLAAYHLPCP